MSASNQHNNIEIDLPYSFLWVDFQIKELEKVLENDIKAQLDLLPSDLEETYIQYFRKMMSQPATTRNLAQRCFLWAFHTEDLLGSGQFIDAVSLGNDNRKTEYSVFDLMEVTRNLLRISNVFLFRVRPVHFSLREFALDMSSDLPAELRFMLPDRETANNRMVMECFRHFLADNFSPKVFDSVIFYCSTYFDSHLRRLSVISEDILQTLDRILLNDNDLLVKILTYRWPTVISGDKYSEVYGCTGNPTSIDPLFFFTMFETRPDTCHQKSVRAP